LSNSGKNSSTPGTTFLLSELNSVLVEANANNGMPADPARQLILERSDLHLSILLAILCFGIGWGAVPDLWIIGWLSVIGVTTLVRYVINYLFVSNSPQNQYLPIWTKRYTLASTSNGLAWGVLGATLYLSPEYIQPVLIFSVLWAMTIFVYYAQFTMPNIFLATVLPIQAPAIAWLGYQQQATTLALGGISLAVLFRMYMGARNTQRTLSRAASLSSHNLELINKLVGAKDNAERVTRKLEQTNLTLAQEISERERVEKEISDSRSQLSSILENMQDPLYQVQMNGTITWVSPSIEHLLGYEPKELLGTDFRNLYVNQDQWQEFVDELVNRNGIVEHFETRLMHKCDIEVWISENAHYRYDAQHNPIGIEGSLRDITERKLTQEALFQEREKAHITLESIGDGVISTDVTGAVEYLNPIAERVTGWSHRDARGESITKVLRLIDEKTDNAIENPAQRALQAGSVFQVAGHPRLVHRYGDRQFSVEVTAAPIRDSEGESVGCVIIFHDVTELRGLARKMSHQASHDALTGLINRREFEIRTEEFLERCRSEFTEHALCYLDLDRFKIVNDTCGHAAGDELLKQLTMLLRAELRSGDTFARLGGDEFGILLEDCPIDDAMRITEVLRRVVEDFRFAWDDKSFRIGVSIGLAPINMDSGNLSDLLSSADTACYIAKEQGRNRVHLLQPDDKSLTERRGQMQWIHRIQEALEGDRFRLYYQPIQHIKGRETGPHGEILLRMLSDQGEIIAPGAFLPSAERYHLMPEVDRWVVRNTFKEMLKTNSYSMDTCSINLSGQSLSDEKFLDFIVHEIDSSGISPRNLCFEITETAVIANLSNATRFISVLRQMGCRFALDDFGSGLSSFAYLKNLPVDYLKLDGSFVKNMIKDNIDRAMVKAINQVGHTMDIQTIAEFVEDDATMQVLSLLGIDYAQGYGIAMPRPLDSFLNPNSYLEGSTETPEVAKKPALKAVVG